MTRRGEVWDADFEPVRGTEQGGIRPAVIVSVPAVVRRGRVIVVPCSTFRPTRPLYPTETLLRAGDGGLTADSRALGDQVRAISLGRLLRRRGVLSPAGVEAVELALAYAEGLPLVPTRKPGP